MAFDMTNTLLDFFVEQFPFYANIGVDPADQTYLDEVLVGPLQDDPTARAYYLIVEPDKSLMSDVTHWRVPVASIKRGMLAANQDFPNYEVGGSLLMVNFFTMSGWLPEMSSKESCYEASGKALRRLERAWAQMAEHKLYLDGVETDDGKETTQVTYPHALTFDGGHFKLRGGENQWYGTLNIRFHVFSAVDRDYALGY